MGVVGGGSGVSFFSYSKRQIFFGFQKWRKATVATIETAPATISTRLLSTWFDQKNWVNPKERPTTRMAGRTSNVSAHPPIVLTSQNGTITAVKGRMRPIIALRSDSGSPHTAAKACTGVPMAPQATGAGLAFRF